MTDCRLTDLKKRNRTMNDKWNRTFLTVASSALGAFALGSSGQAQTVSLRPNIVVILTDDLGYGDVRANNPEAKTETPHLNRLAEEGMRFTDGHSSDAVCSPSRYGLLTGRYAWRTSLKKGVLGRSAPLLIEDNCDTLASLLKRNGYSTAVVGKWHLGLGGNQTLDVKFSSAPVGLQPGPNQRGFDFSCVIPASLNMGPYIYLENLQPVNGADGTPAPPFARWETIQGNGDYPAPTGYDPGFITPGFDPHYDAHPEATPRFNRVVPHLTDKADGWINLQASDGQPFFLYFALPSPHTPWVPDMDPTGLTDEQLYMAYVRETDAAVGRIVETLREKGQLDNTLIVFSSDNGPELRRFDKGRAGYSPSGIYRGMKSDLYEGGHRVPLIASWPQHIPPGSVSDQLICLTDLYRTIAALVGDQRPAGLIGGEDSVDFSPLFLGRPAAEPIRGNLVYHSDKGRFGIRMGNWAFLDWPGSGGYLSPDSNPEGTPGQLFNLKEDPSEQDNLYAANPERITGMKAVLSRIKGEEEPPPAVRATRGLQKMVFKNADADQNGVISREEFIARHKSVNPGVGAGEVRFWFSKKDLNHDGQLTKEEFLSDRNKK
jgi:arylsulfatase A-like enzyme